MSVGQSSTPSGAMAAFRRRVDAFFGDPRRRSWSPRLIPGALRAPATAKAASARGSAMSSDASTPRPASFSSARASPCTTAASSR